ncbi:MAG: sugar phosphate isomerase/epimerase [Clostridiales bacterium]|nr:sugar phosphate isomerase/epimerase [Clostridiales bacterium]
MLPIAYQLYSTREEAEKNLEKVLADLQAIGFDGVEFAGFYGKSAEEITALLKKYQLKGISSHVAMDLAKADPFGIIAYHQQIGCEYIVIPYLEEKQRPGGENFAATLQWMYSFGKLCKKGGIQLLYHNHDFEFDMLSGQYGLDFLFDAVPQDRLASEIDTCWVHYAGVNPGDYVRKYQGRCPLVHVKDYVGTPSEEGSPYGLLGAGEADEEVSFMYKPLGQGINDIKDVVKAAKESGAKWLVFEMDESPEMPPMEAAKISFDFLKPLA